MAAPAAAFGLALVALVAWLDGGFFPPAWGVTTLALAGVAAVTLLVRPRIALGRLELVSLGALGALGAWIALSALWSASVAPALLELERALVYLSAVGTALVLLTRASARGLVAGILTAIVAVSAWNLSSHLFPGLHGIAAPSRPRDVALPVGYANAVAVLAALAVPLSLGLARAGGYRWGRPAAAAAAAALPLLLATIAVNESRGAWLALGLGLLVVLALRLPRPGVATGLALAGGLAVLGLASLAASEQRAAYWRVALAAVRDQPVLGSGAGSWGRIWLEQRDVALATRDAHSLYLETLAELGPVGLALLLAVLVPPLVAALRARHRPLVPATAGAFAVFVLHAGVDWDWEVPAVSLAGLVAGCALLAAAREERHVLGSRLPALGVAGALALLGGIGLAGNGAVAAAEEALAAGRWVPAERAAARAVRFAPWSAEARRLRGEAQAAQGRPRAAAASFRAGLERDGGDVELWLALARVTAGEERRAALRQAARLNPLGVGRVALQGAPARRPAGRSPDVHRAFTFRPPMSRGRPGTLSG